MKKTLLGNKKNFYKANLHCHSTISDGSKTPEELKEMYMEKGYSIIAYTDHDVLLDHSELTDSDFLALNGFEAEITKPDSKQTCHLCYIALSPDNLTQPCWHRELYLFGNAPKYGNLVKFDKSKPDFVREYTPECINKMIQEGRDNGFFVTYNHPSWSMETAFNYGAYSGMNAMEICNYSCLESGYADYNEQQYDEMLRMGKKIRCISADDNHNYRNDSFGGFTVINADSLTYRSITEALENGDFYASCGPEIHELWYENEKIGIKCSPCASIKINTGYRFAKQIHASNAGGITEAVFDVEDIYSYVRITVTDFSGKPANTSAYFVEDLKK